jgi:hypothetical protein
LTVYPERVVSDFKHLIDRSYKNAEHDNGSNYYEVVSNDILLVRDSSSQIPDWRQNGIQCRENHVNVSCRGRTICRGSPRPEMIPLFEYESNAAAVAYDLNEPVSVHERYVLVHDFSRLNHGVTVISVEGCIQVCRPRLCVWFYRCFLHNNVKRSPAGSKRLKRVLSALRSTYIYG